MNTIINRAKVSKAFFVFSTIYILGFILLVWGGAIFESQAAIHISLALMVFVAPATGVGSVLLQNLLHRRAKQVAVC